MKTCHCGLTHDAEQWVRLDYVGPLDDGYELLELRNCLCGSTLAVLVGLSGTGHEALREGGVSTIPPSVDPGAFDDRREPR